MDFNLKGKLQEDRKANKDKSEFRAMYLKFKPGTLEFLEIVFIW